MKKFQLLCLAISFISISVVAQWSSDPSENTALSLAAGEQAIPKIATSESGTSYISWFSNESGNYNVRLQKLDMFGVIQWDSAGLLVSDNPAMTWLTEWDMTIDLEDHAILTFQDIRNGNNDAFAYRISPEGEFIWGDDGIEISTGPAFDAAPKVCITNSNNAVFAWQADEVVILQKISPEGEKQWGENGIILSGTNTYSWPQLLAVGDDDVILKYFEDSGPVWAPTRHVFAQHYDTNGDPVWASPAIVSNAGGISAWTQVFSFINDGEDGFYIAWHDDRYGENLSSTYVHHIGPDGEILLEANGVEASLYPDRNNFYPHLGLPDGSDEIFVYWNEMDANQNNRGIYGQKISASGERLWTNSGKVFIEISPTNVYPIAASNSETDMIVIYEEYSDALNAGIKAMRIDTEGNYVWEDETIDICTVQSEKVHSVAGSFFNDQWIASWEDSRNGGKDIYAQNIQLDGSLGPVTIGGLEIFPDTLCFEQNPQWKQIYIINNTIETHTIDDIDESGFLYWTVDPYPLLPYELLAGDSLILNVFFECWIDSQVFDYLYEPLNVISGSDTLTAIICVDESLMVGYIDYKSNLLQVFPNPAKDYISFQLILDQANNTELIIFDSFGKVIITFTPQANNTIAWDLKNKNGQKVPAGIYYYRLISEEHQESGKIILIE